MKLMKLINAFQNVFVDMVSFIKIVILKSFYIAFNVFSYDFDQGNITKSQLSSLNLHIL